MATPSGEADSLEPLQPEGKSMWGWALVIVNRLLAFGYHITNMSLWFREGSDASEVQFFACPSLNPKRPAQVSARDPDPKPQSLNPKP